jgi:hypothetical protein
MDFYGHKKLAIKTGTMVASQAIFTTQGKITHEKR